MGDNHRASAVVARYKSALVFPSDKALKNYLHEHPKADPKNHQVAPEGEAAPSKEDGKKPDKKKEKGEGIGGKAKSFFKSLSEKARDFVSKSSAEVQKLVSDPTHRKEVMKEASKSVMASPKTYAKRLVSTAKSEVKEFKEAGEAIASLAKGKKLEPQQKKALKTVAIHMGVAVAAAALTSTGVLAGAAALGKGMATKVAMKAAIRSLENVHLMQEVQHIGHGVMHLLASEEGGDEKLSPEDAFAMLVMSSVQKELEDFDDDSMTEVLEEASGGVEKESREFEAMLKTAVLALVAIDGIVGGFDRVLLAAKTKAASDGLPQGRVWQDRFKALAAALEPSFEELRGVEARLGEFPSRRLAGLVGEVRGALAVPRMATAEYAISDVDFAHDVVAGRDGLTYNAQKLKEWGSKLGEWATSTQGTLVNARKRAYALV